MNEFTKLEIEGRNRLMSDFKPDIQYEFTQDQFNPIDCFITAGTKKYAVEIKNRTFSIDKYDEFILEKHKYINLIKAYINSGYTPVYRMYFTDGQLTWVIKPDMELNTQHKKCSKTTAVNYIRGEIEKEVIMLKKEYSNEYKHSNHSDNKQKNN